MGLGGGTFLGPLFLIMNFHINMTRATTNFLVLLTSFISSFQFALDGNLDFSYGIPFSILGALAAFTGNFLLKFLIKKIGRPSIFMYFLGALFLITMILVFWNLITKIKYDSDYFDVWSFNSLCAKTGEELKK